MRIFCRLLFVAFLFTYFGIASLYLLPRNPMKNYLANSVGENFEKVFYQNWSFFSNPGNVYLSLLIKCGNSEDWLDPSSLYLNQHQTYRLPSSGKLLYHYRSYATIANSLLIEIQKKDGDKMLIFKYKEILSSFSINECNDRHLSADNIKMALLIRKVRKFSQRRNSNLFDSAEVAPL